MAVTTLLHLAAQHYADAQGAVARAQRAAEAAEARSAGADKALAAGAAAVADLQKRLAAIRNQLAAVPTPVDADPLLDDLARTIIALRGAEADQLQAEADAAAARWAADRAAAELS